MSFINNIQGTVDKNTGKYAGGLFNGMDAGLGNAMGAIGGAVGGIAGGAIAGGRESTAGSVISGLGDVASTIPGPWGAIAGAGLKMIGGLTNAAFGVKLNQENINAVNNNIASMNSFQSNASDFDSLTSNFQSSPAAMRFDQKFIGKNGWFNKGATKKFNQLQAQQDAAEQFVSNSLGNNLNNIVNTQNQNLLASYAALGGFLPTQGADWATGLNYIGAGGSHEQNPNNGVQMGVAPDGQPNLVEEGEVVWNGDYVFSKRLKVPKSFKKKYKVGKEDEPLSFAEAAQLFNKEMEERPNDPISRRGRDANLARLASSQEEKRARIALKEQQDNIFRGIQPMITANGGTIHIDKNKRGTFTAAASRHGMGVQEFASKVLANPDDYSPAMRKKANFARNASKWKHAGGGHLFAYGTPGSYFDYDDFDLARMFSMPSVLNPIQSSRHIYSSLNEPWVAGNTLPEASTFQVPVKNKKGQWVLGKPQEWGSVETPEARAAVRSVVPGVTSKRLNTTTLPPISGLSGVTLPGNKWENVRNNIAEGTKEDSRSSWLTGLRYVPAIGSAIGVFSDLMGWTNKPDYSSADAILRASRGVRDVSFTPIGDYMRYTPFDRMFYLNQLNANAGATRRAIINQSAGNRGTAIAGILAADNNVINSIGNLARQAEEYNLAQRQKVAEFNKATNMFNSEGFLKARQANQGAAEVRMRAAQAAAAMRDAIDQRVGAAKSANLTNLFDSLGNIGREEAIREMINSNPAWYYMLGRDGRIGYKKQANGGFITIKKRRK